MKRWLWLCLSAVALAAPLALPAKYPAAARGVYYGGMVHYVSVEDGNPPQVSHWAWTYTPDWHFDWGAHPTARLSLDAGSKWLDPNDHDHGQGVAVLNGVLCHFAILLDSDNAPALYVTRYDLTQNTFLGYRKLAAVKYPSGSIESGGVAAAVLNSTLYVFTDSCTLASTDTVNWTRLDGLINNHILLDATAFYPHDAPAQIMLLFMNASPGNPGLGAVFWSGPSGGTARYVTIDPYVSVHSAAVVSGTARLVTAAVGGSSIPGSTDYPCLQIFALTLPNWTSDDYAIRRYEYRIGADTWQAQIERSNNAAIDRLRVAPWYVTNFDPNDPGATREVQKQTLAVSIYECSDTFCIIHDHQYWAYASDVLVAQNQDPSTGGYGWQGVPTSTGQATEPSAETLRKYWTLAGVVFGPPPFALNDLSIDDIHDLSNVEYGSEQSGTVSHKQVWGNSCMFSSGTQISGGIGHVAHVEEDLDVSYKHAWENTHKDTSTHQMGFLQTFGTDDESPGVWGSHGWAVFICPTLVTQDYDIYAYDYDDASGTGSFLGQEIYTVATGEAAVRAFGFQLCAPGGPEDDVPGLLAGLPASPSSMDLMGWTNMTWEGPESDGKWEVIAGTGQHGGVAAPVVTQGVNTQCHFTQDTKTLDSEGQTSDIEVSESTSIALGLGVAGFKETVTAGYDSHYSAETDVETEISTSIGYSLHLPYLGSECTDPECVKKLTVQPYLLQATDYSAPWVPPGYEHQLPWCMTWQVTHFETLGGQRGGMAAEPKMAAGTVIGTLGAAGGATSWPTDSNYKITRGRMAWLEEDGQETPIPMAAKEFNRALGASVSINGRTFSCDGSSGRWRRQGKVWKFKSTRTGAGERYSLKLDFGADRWTFDVKKGDLSDVFAAADTHAHVVLTVNGRYSFYCDFAHFLSADWDLSLQATIPEALEVTRYTGSYNSLTGEGNAFLAGDMPNTLASFGDFSILVNGHRRDMPLLSQEGFIRALTNGEEFVYEKGGTRFWCDFGARRWEVTLQGQDFHRLIAPLIGQTNLKIQVGGATQYEGRHPILRYNEQLFFSR